MSTLLFNLAALIFAPYILRAMDGAVKNRGSVALTFWWGIAIYLLFLAALLAD